PGCRGHEARCQLRLEDGKSRLRRIRTGLECGRILRAPPDGEESGDRHGLPDRLYARPVTRGIRLCVGEKSKRGQAFPGLSAVEARPGDSRWKVQSLCAAR